MALSSVEFEKLLSARPKIVESGKEPCLRDLILHYYEDFCGEDQANTYVKAYTDDLYKLLGVK